MPPDSQGKTSIAFRGIGYILLFGVIISLIFFLLSAVKFANYPFGLEYAEGYLLENARRLAEGQNIYGDITHYPFTSCNYPILYPLVLGILLKMTGLTFSTGRWISIISTLASCWLIGFILLRLTRDQLLSVVCGALFLCIPPVFRWGQVLRVDTMGMALSLAGIAAYITARDDRGRAWCVPLLIAAFLTKQSFIAAPIAVLIHWLIDRRRDGVLPAVISIIIGAVIYLLINAATSWGMFHHNLFYTVHVFYPTRLAAGFNLYLSLTGPVILIALFNLGSGRPGFKSSPIPIYFILASLSVIPYGSEGSDSNWFVEPYAAALLLAGVGIHEWIKQANGNQNGKSAKWISLFLMVILLMQLAMVRVLKYDEFLVADVGPRDVADGERIVKIIKNVPGDVISEEPSFQILAGKPVLYKAYVFAALARKGMWDQSEFVDDLRDARFDLVILRFNVFDPNHPDQAGNIAYQMAGFNRFTDEMEGAIAEAYELDPYVFHSGHTWYVYRPKSGNPK